MNKIINRMLIIFTLLLGCSFAVVANDDMTPVFKTSTNIKNPLDLRDPFKRKLNKLKKKVRVSALDGLSGSREEDLLQNVTLEQIRVVGVIVGPERRAIIKIDPQGSDGSSQESGSQDNDQRSTIFVKEGTRIGSDDSEVKAILPGGIVIVNKIKNVYDQDEYLETVIPITEE